MISHHPSEAILLDFAAGHLAAGQNTVVRTHLALCPQCRRDYRLIAECCGAMMQDITPVAMQDEALASTLARLDLQDLPQPPRKVPTTVSEFATGSWRWVGPGLRMMALQRRDDEDCRLDLLSVSAGLRIPEHTHTGIELTCVLQGGFSDGPADYRAGDLIEADASVDHQPVAMDLGEPCVCLVATTGHLRARNSLIRTVHRILDL